MQQTAVDQLQRTITCPREPRRIVSLVPSQTEWLFSLGLEDRISGVTWFCEHPAGMVEHKPKIGGTKKVKLDRVRELNPDLIIANKEENVQEQVAVLEQDFPVWISDVYDLESALEMMRCTATITGKRGPGSRLTSRIEKQFHDLDPEKGRNRRILYLIWRDPWMSVGGDTFISKMIEAAGWTNVLAHRQRYPGLQDEDFHALQPDWVFLSSEPFPFQKKHIEEVRRLYPYAGIILVDGSYFSWYGSRLLGTPDYLRRLQRDTRNNRAVLW